MRSLAAQVVRQLPTTASLRLDGDLLAGFLTHGTEDDFAELVRRHGPLVWGVCRRALPDAADAEDAFQATFLVLLRRGRKLTGYPTIGPWLHKVAAWTARNVRRRNARRLARQSALPVEIAVPAADRDLPLDIDAALLALPEKFRSPIVLCHLLGYSRADAAIRLGCAEGTLSAWLSRGLARLRGKFGSLDPARPLGIAAVAVPAVLSTSVVRAAMGARLAAATTAAVSSTVSQVVEGVIRMFWIKKATAASMAACVVFALGVGVGISGRMVEGVAEGQEKTAITSPLSGSDMYKEVFELMGKLKLAEAEMESLQKKIVDHRDQLDRLISEGKTPEQIQSAVTSYAKVVEEVVRAATKKKALEDRLEGLKDTKNQGKKPLPKPNEPKTDLERIDQRLEDLRLRWQTVEAEAMRIKADADLAAKRFDLLAQERKAIDDVVASLMKQRNEIVGKKPAVAAKAAGYLELTVRGTAAQYQFALREFDAAGNEVGTVAFADSIKYPAMLAKVLARTKADPTAPTEMRVLASPPTALGGGPLAALKACDMAGYKTVKFTGYVVGGGFTQELKIGDRGVRPGYTWFDGVERKTTELMKEIEDGMRTL